MMSLDRLFPRQARHASTHVSQPVTDVAPESDLRARRDALAREVAERQLDLGGLTYEMAIRDHFRLDVLLRAAARMQEADAQLAEADRVLHLEEHGAAGTCPGCNALRSRNAVFCWQCGIQLMSRMENAA